MLADRKRVLAFHLSSLFLFPLHRSFPLHCRHIDFVTTFCCFQALSFFFVLDPTDPKLEKKALDGKRRKKWDGRRNLLSLLGPLLLLIYPKIREIFIGSQMDHKITENAFKNYRVTLEIILSPFETKRRKFMNQVIVSPNFQSSLGGIRTEILRAMFDQNCQNVGENDEWAKSLYILSTSDWLKWEAFRSILRLYLVFYIKIQDKNKEN